MGGVPVYTHMNMDGGRPLIVQGDLSILLDVHDPSFEEARAAIGAFASLEKSPEHLHSYRMTPLSLWNAAGAGLSPTYLRDTLERYSRYELPHGLLSVVSETMARYGALVISALPADSPEDSDLWLSLTCHDRQVSRELATSKRLARWLVPSGDGFLVRMLDRGTVKQELIRLGWPVHDAAPLREGDPFPIALRTECLSGKPFAVRPYQSDAVDAFLGRGSPGTGFGIIALPCGAGKTIVGMAVMAALSTKVLIVTTNIAAVHQWMDELIDKTALTRDVLGEYTGQSKEIRPVTVATYQILAWRPDRQSDFPHFRLLREENWGLLICDEVHLLPAPVFRVVAEIQAMRRLGLTATLIREDGLEEDVFSLIGPKRYDIPWKDLERKGFIAEAYCREIRIPLAEQAMLAYAVAEPREKIRKAAENEAKQELVKELVDNHPDEGILIMGQYLHQLHLIAGMLRVPLVTGSTPNADRERIYAGFRAGEIRIIVVSKVANFAIDLPDASVAIQISGSFGSRQEEAQRLGRILRPKSRNSWFYTLVSRFTIEEEFAANRRKFLTEQGYRYSIEARE